MLNNMSGRPVSVLFVCLGNICRSPTAHGVLAHMVRKAGVEHLVRIESAGTGAWHIGSAPDARTCEAAARRGYDLSAQRARQVTPEDLRTFDLVLAMDRQNLANLRQLKSDNHGCGGEPQLFLEVFGERPGPLEMPDPYYGGADGFDHVLDLAEVACRNLLSYLQKTRLS